MPTKQDILDELALLPLSKLEVLQKYQQYLIIPTEDLLVNVTMQQMVTKAHEYADVFFPEWTDRSASDFGQFLVELFGVFSEKDFWYVNAFANQALLTKMSVYSIAFTRAVELGYRPVRATSATATFSLIFNDGAYYNYATGGIIVEVNGTKFTNTSIISVPTTVNNYTLATTLTQGSYNNETYSFNGRSVDLRKANIDPRYIEVTVEGVSWTRVEVFGASGPTSTHFMVIPEEDGKCSIFFGEDDYGKKPTVGSLIEVKYLTCDASLGSIPQDTATINTSSSNRPLNAVTMSTASTGGFDPSTLAQLKQEALTFFNYRQSCLNEASTVAWLKAQPEVSKAYVAIAGTNVFFFFRNKQGDAPTLTEISDVTTRIDPLVSNGFNALYTATVTEDVATIDVDFFYLAGYDPSEIESVGKQLIQDFTNPAVLADYGVAFDLSEVSLLLRSKIPGLNNVTFNTVAGLAAANIPCATSHIMQKIALGDITVNMIQVV